MRTATVMVSPVTPRDVAPPLLPENPMHGGEYVSPGTCCFRSVHGPVAPGGSAPRAVSAPDPPAPTPAPPACPAAPAAPAAAPLSTSWSGVPAAPSPFTLTTLLTTAGKKRACRRNGRAKARVAP